LAADRPGGQYTRRFFTCQVLDGCQPPRSSRYNWGSYDMNYHLPVLGEYGPAEQIMAYTANTNHQLFFAESKIYLLRRNQTILPSQATPIRYTSDKPLLRNQSR
jgi:hypothetical protein